MKILWTKANNPADWLIHAVTGEDCAHMAILFESVAGVGVIFESNFLGVRICFYNNWVKNRTIVHELAWDLHEGQENYFFDQIVTRFDGNKYDFGGVLFLGLMKLRKRMTGQLLPVRNKWAKQKETFCDEVYQLLSGLATFPLISAHENAMMSPHDVYRYLMASKFKTSPNRIR
jgi:hypothetical protein